MRQQRMAAAFHLERSTATRMGVTEYPCACPRCRGAGMQSTKTISRHHRRFGRDPYLPHPVLVSPRLANSGQRGLDSCSECALLWHFKGTYALINISTGEQVEDRLETRYTRGRIVEQTLGLKIETRVHIVKIVE